MRNYDQLPPRWDVNQPSTWELRSMVDTFVCRYDDGVVCRRYKWIRHSATRDPSFDPSAPVGVDAAQWWHRVLGPLHDLQCWVTGAMPDDPRLKAIRDKFDIGKGDGIYEHCHLLAGEQPIVASARAHDILNFLDEKE